MVNGNFAVKVKEISPKLKLLKEVIFILSDICRYVYIIFS